MADEFGDDIQDNLHNVQQLLAEAVKSAADLNDTFGKTLDLSASLSKQAQNNLKEIEKGNTVSGHAASKLVDELQKAGVQGLENGRITSSQADKFIDLASIIDDNTRKLGDYHEVMDNVLGVADAIGDKFTGWITKIPGMGFLEQRLGLDKIKKQLSVDIGGELIKLNKGTQSIGDTFINVGKFGAGAMKKIMVAAGPIALIALAMTSAIARFMELDKAAADFRKTTGLTASQTAGLEKQVRSLNKEYQHMGVTIEGAFNAAAALTEEFNTLNAISDVSIKNAALLESTLNISAKTSAGFTKNMMAIAGVSQETASNMSMWVVKLSSAAGVAPAKIMEDIANSSDDTTAAFAGMPGKLAEAAVKARLLGTNINDVASATRGLLDFQGSINAEMEASTLIGKSINLQKARQLRFEGDVMGAQMETLRVIEQAGDLSAMNVFQQEALAKATGMSVNEMHKQVAAKKNLVKFGVDMEKLDKTALAAMGSQRDMTQEQLDAVLRENDSRSKQAQIMDQLKAAWVSISEVLFPVVAILVDVFIPILKVAMALIKGLAAPFILVFDLIKSGIDAVMEMFPGVGNAVDMVAKALKVVGMIIGSIIIPFVIAMALPFIVIAAKVALVVAGIWLVIEAAKFLFNMLWEGIKLIGTGVKFAFGIWLDMWGGIIDVAKFFFDLWWDGIKFIGSAFMAFFNAPMESIRLLGDMFMIVWNDALNWVEGLFPGLIGTMVGYFDSFVDYLSDILMSPFIKLQNFVLNTFSNIKEYVVGIFTDIGSWISEKIEGIPFIGGMLGGLIPFAEGGVVTSPTAGLVGEAGPEAVIPLDKIGDLGGGMDVAPITNGIDETNILLRQIAKLLSEGQVIEMDGQKIGGSIARATKYDF